MTGQKIFRGAGEGGDESTMDDAMVFVLTYLSFRWVAGKVGKVGGW